MDKGTDRKWGRLAIHWLFFVTSAVVLFLALNPIVRESSRMFLYLYGGITVLYVLYAWAHVHVYLARPLKTLLRGMLGETKELPANEPGPIGEAAQMFLHLKQDEERFKQELHSANATIRKLTATETELNSEITKLKDSAADKERLLSELNNTVDNLERTQRDNEEQIGKIESERDLLIKYVEDTFNSIIKGNYSQRSDDHFPALSKKTAELNEYINNISNKADLVTGECVSQVRRISDLCSQLVSNANNNEFILQGLNEKSQDMAQQAAKNTELTGKTSSIATSTKNQFETGNKVIKEMNETMQEIDSMSGNILNIIKSIDDIAFQTQLLSLNASIEAARAGRYGQSFAVVASKVGELAGKSKESADETSTLLENMIRKFHEGVAMSEKTASIMSAFLDSLNQIIGIVDETKDNIALETRTVNEIINSTQTMSASVNDNKFTTEEIMSSVNSLENSMTSDSSLKFSSPKPVFQPKTVAETPKPVTFTPKPAPIAPKPAVTPITAAPKPTAAPLRPASQTPLNPVTPIKVQPKAPSPIAINKPAPAITPAPAHRPPVTPPPKPVEKDAPTTPKIVVSNVKPTGFDGSSEYNKKDYGKY